MWNLVSFAFAFPVLDNNQNLLCWFSRLLILINVSQSFSRRMMITAVHDSLSISNRLSKCQNQYLWLIQVATSHLFLVWIQRKGLYHWGSVNFAAFIRVKCFQKFAIGSVHFFVIFQSLHFCLMTLFLVTPIYETDSANAKINSVTQPLIATCYSNTHHARVS